MCVLYIYISILVVSSTIYVRMLYLVTQGNDYPFLLLLSYTSSFINTSEQNQHLSWSSSSASQQPALELAAHSFETLHKTQAAGNFGLEREAEAVGIQIGVLTLAPDVVAICDRE